MEYAWTKTSKLTDQQQDSFLKYIDDNKDYLIEIDDFLFDKKSVTNNFCLSQCLDCGNFQ